MRIALLVLLFLLKVIAFGDTEFSLSTQNPGNLFYSGSAIEITFTAPSDRAEWILWSVTDVEGKRVDGGRFRLLKKVTFSPKVESTGLYFVSCKLQNSKSPVATTRFAVIHKILLAKPEVQPYGINVASANEPETLRATQLELSERLGSAWGRSALMPAVSQSSEEKSEWQKSDAAVKMCERHKIALVSVVRSFENSSASSNSTEEEVTRFGRYIEAVAERYKEKIRVWEIGSEPLACQSSVPSLGAEDYAKLLREAYLRIKGCDPSAVVLGCVALDKDFDFLGRVLNAIGGQYFDALSICAYLWDEQAAKKYLCGIHDLLRVHGIEKPIWVNEIGWPTGKKWLSEEEQAKMLVRVFAVCLEEGVQRLFYSDTVDRAPSDSETWQGLTGLFDVDETPKIATVAFNEMVYQLNGMRFAGSVDLGDNVYGKLFVKGDEQVLVIWTSNREPVDIELGTNVSGIQVYDMLGRRRIVGAESGVLKLRVTDRPQYVRLTSPGLLPQAGFKLEASPIARGTTGEVTVTLTGMAAGFVQKVRLITPPGWVVTPEEADVKPKQNMAFCRFEVTVPAATHPGKFEITAVSTEGLPLSVTKTILVQDPIAIQVFPPRYLDPDRSELQIRLDNQTRNPIKGELRVSSTRFVVRSPVNTIPPGESRQIRILIAPKDARADQSYVINVCSTIPGIQDVNKKVVLPLIGLRKAVSGIEVDGSLADWTGIKPIFTSSRESHVNFSGKWSGDEDHSARAWLAWDDRWLYIAVDVRDDKIVWPTSEKVWEQDSLQLGFDPMNDAVGEGYDDDDFEILVAKMHGEARIFVSQATYVPDISKIKVAISERPNKGVTYEIAIPSELFGPSGMRKFRLIGFSFLVNDNDGRGRESFLQLSPGIGLSKDPSVFKDLWLIE